MLKSIKAVEALDRLGEEEGGQGLDTEGSHFRRRFGPGGTIVEVKRHQRDEDLRVEKQPFLAPKDVIFGVDFTGPYILVVNFIYSYRTFGDLDWEDENIKDEEINPGNPGVYYSKKYVVRKDDKTVDTEKSLLPDEPELNGKGLCTPPTAGETWAKWKFMMICDDVFTRPKLVDLYAEQKTLAVGTSVDKVQTAGAEMLHEMMHFINQQIGDYKFPNGNGGQRAAYFWKNCVALAMQSIDQGKPNLALKNADNYRTFSLAVALDLIDWDENGQVPDPNAAHDEEL
ncbi:uncharacterized protein N7459_003584 [Penicillium hispanicum]|uniref:uncharacterized protein n=1 Tax=Penicillium hispanicum TaxID=1080232 RepID=UPI00253FD573|nr:uncharacterized protein N7459_003584 [Penicillium hispanicum]KAJ5587819.1 hypothetical protein N7459_003584 [Penicillium hispanicum]